MGYFNKIFIQEIKTGNLVDITNLDKEHYESFLDAMQKLNIAYKEALKSCKSCKWMKVGYGHCNFCIHAHDLSKYDKSCSDNFEPKTDE